MEDKGINPVPVEDKNKSEIEVKPQRQQEEVAKIVRNNLLRESDNANRGLTTIEEVNNAPKSKKEIATLRRLAEISPAEVTGEKSFDLTTTIDGEEKQIVSLKRIEKSKNENKNEDTFVCADKDGNEITLTRDEVIDSQVLSHADDIAENFTGAQRQTFDLFVKNKREGINAYPEEEATTINGIIKEAAEASSMVSVDDLRELVANTVAESKAKFPEDADLADKQGEIALQALKGKNLADAETTMQVLSGLNLNPETLNNRAEALKATIKDLEAKLAANPSDENLKQQLVTAKENLDVSTLAAEALKENGPLQKLFSDIESGKYNKDEAEAIKNSLRTGKVEDVIKVVAAKALEDDPNDTPEQREAKLKKRMEIDKIAKYGGLGILALLALLATGVFYATNEALKGSK